jgi:hypothetical protein
MRFLTEVEYVYELVSSRAVVSALCSLLITALPMGPFQLSRKSQAVLRLPPVFKDQRNREETIAKYVIALRTIKKDVT